MALDDFFRHEGLEHVYHVAIDTEGWDALVVEGMRDSLRQRRVSLVEFEVNNRGMWNRLFSGREARTVNGTLNMLHDANKAAGNSVMGLRSYAVLKRLGGDEEVRDGWRRAGGEWPHRAAHSQCSWATAGW